MDMEAAMREDVKRKKLKPVLPIKKNRFNNKNMLFSFFMCLNLNYFLTQLYETYQKTSYQKKTLYQKKTSF